MDNKPNDNRKWEEMNELPVPDQEQAWQDMKRRLEEDRDRRFIPPVWLKSCAGLALGLLLLSLGGWFLWKKELFTGNKNSQIQQHKSASPTQGYEEKKSIPTQDSISGYRDQTVNTTSTNPGEIPDNTASKIERREIKNEKMISNEQSGKKKTISQVPASKKRKTDDQLVAVKEEVNVNEKSMLPSEQKTSDQNVITGSEDSASFEADTAEKKSPVVPDTVIKKTDTLLVDPGAEKTKKPKTKALIVSAGLGVQQQIALNGQKAVPYDYYGRSSSLSDYIPSVFLRLEKQQQWFVQAEFRYGAPQSVKEFSYSRQTTVDSMGTNVKTTTLRLKKTYYHQLPVSFNYYVRPQWSVGAGGVYSRFYGAVTEQEDKNKNVQTQQETVSRRIVTIPNFTDSFLYRSQVHLLLQTDYHWRRLSLGLRYTKDVQPYIKYTKPDGHVDEEKNQSLQFILRYRLWQSRKK